MTLCSKCYEKDLMADGRAKLALFLLKMHKRFHRNPMPLWAVNVCLKESERLK